MEKPDLSKMDVRNLCECFAREMYTGGDVDIHIAELERRMTPPPGYVRIGDKDVKVLDIETLPMTKDGVRVVPGASYVYSFINGKVCRNYNWTGWAALFHEIDGAPYIGADPTKCYSTSEACEAAEATMENKA